ncbi:MAG: hypothetical protein CMM74_00560 [Rhodospirillaceae bacterium]|jgi:hypothetical protein|nr:hypothetical protein [Rhodospirillaceae bacterium]
MQPKILGQIGAGDAYLFGYSKLFGFREGRRGATQGRAIREVGFKVKLVHRSSMTENSVSTKKGRPRKAALK